MTKNKKRKTILRAIAENEGVGIARAGLLHDRERTEKPLDTAPKSLVFDMWLGRIKELADRHNIPIDFGTDSPYSSYNTETNKAHKLDTPHYVISKGTKEERFLFMDSVRKYLEGIPEASVTVITKEKLTTHLLAATVLQTMRKNEMRDSGVESFTELREKFIKDNAVYMFELAPVFSYFFIYDWEELMADVSDEIKDLVYTLLQNGKKAGSHFFISSGVEDSHINEWHEDGLARFITIQDAGEKQ